ncbi:putative oxidoreductase [Acorus calamus]|uniref:Oxidoreductase n=1 Tax=Acorus calamus TaxID=4465 RepID=A0AAV9DSW5_ACOCL|nr:putative oxidoreductase [Acorus calamus]
MRDKKLKEAKAAFDVSVDGGITFFDTAEVYGTSTPGSVTSESLLGRPGILGNEGWIDGLGDTVEQGLVKAVGLSNYGEENAVKAACDELGITLIAYSPILQGMLTGKYTPEKLPSGPRGKLQPILKRIKEIGQSYGKTNTQVVLNWLTSQGNVLPIHGAKNAEQAKEFTGALGWNLTGDVAELRSLAMEAKPVIGFPVQMS